MDTTSGSGKKAADRRKLLILDLDETLIHARTSPLPDRAADFRVARYHVYRRPHLDTFLRGVSEDFDIAVWTSASRDYAAEVVRAIYPHPDKLIFVWDAMQCVKRFDPETFDFYDLKPILKVYRRHRQRYKKGEIIAVDDTPRKWSRSYGNLVRVFEWEGDPDDDELLHLLAYLRTLRDVANVRTVEKRAWRGGDRKGPALF